MVKTTIYLPERLKRRVEQIARIERRSEAEVIRAALEDFTAVHERPRPTLPLFSGPAQTNIAERVDEALAEGFGRD